LVTLVPTPAPSVSPSLSTVPSASPTAAPTISSAPSSAPTLDDCKITPGERVEQILALLDAVADPALIRDVTTPQGMAAQWLIEIDFRRICPDEEKLLQRWVIAVVYFSTGGDDWFQCSATGSDACGTENPFRFKRRFLSEFSECQWAGISCNADSCVTEIEFGKHFWYRENANLAAVSYLISHCHCYHVAQRKIISSVPSLPKLDSCPSWLSGGWSGEDYVEKFLPKLEI
jgi:hypothetical protein